MFVILCSSFKALKDKFQLAPESLTLRKRKDREFRGTVPSRLHTMEGDNFPNQKQAAIAKAAKWILNSQKSNMTTTADPLNILQSGLEDVTYVHEELNK